MEHMPLLIDNQSTLVPIQLYPKSRKSIVFSGVLPSQIVHNRAKTVNVDLGLPEDDKHFQPGP